MNTLDKDRADILEMLLADFFSDEKVVSKYYRPSDNRWDLQKKYVLVMKKGSKDFLCVLVVISRPLQESLPVCRM